MKPAIITALIFLAGCSVPMKRTHQTTQIQTSYQQLQADSVKVTNITHTIHQYSPQTGTLIRTEETSYTTQQATTTTTQAGERTQTTQHTHSAPDSTYTTTKATERITVAKERTTLAKYITVTVVAICVVVLVFFALRILRLFRL